MSCIDNPTRYSDAKIGELKNPKLSKIRAEIIFFTNGDPFSNMNALLLHRNKNFGYIKTICYRFQSTFWQLLALESLPYLQKC